MPVPLLTRAGMVAPFIVTEVEFSTAVITPPLHVVAAFAGVAMRSCPEPEFAAGSVSVNVAAVIGFAEMLRKVNIIVEIAFSANGPAGENDFSVVNVSASTLDEVVFDAPPLHVAPPL